MPWMTLLVRAYSMVASLNRLEGIMNMLVDISSHIQATKEGMQEMRVERSATSTHAEPLYQ